MNNFTRTATSIQQKMMTQVQYKQAAIEKEMKALEEKKKDSKNPAEIEKQMGELQQKFGLEFQKIQAEGKSQDESLKTEAEQIMADFVKEAKARGYKNIQFSETCLPGSCSTSEADEIIAAMRKKTPSTLQKIENKIEKGVKEVAKKVERAL